MNVDVSLRVLMRGVVDRPTARAWADDAALTRLVADDVLTEDDGLLYLSDHGDRLLTEQLQALITPADTDPLAAFGREFGVLDSELKSAMTDWQAAQRAGDADGQLTAVERWLNIDRRLHNAANNVRRLFASYLDGLADARDAVLDGNPERLTGTDDTSYHSQWFLLHEVLLRSLGQQRTG